MVSSKILLEEILVFTDFRDESEDYSVVIINLGTTGEFTRKKIAIASYITKAAVQASREVMQKVQASIDTAYGRGTFHYVNTLKDLITSLEINANKPERILKLSENQYYELLNAIGVSYAN